MTRRRGRSGGAVDGPLLRRARRHSVLQTSAAIGAVLLLVGVLMYVLESREQSRALDRELSRVVAAADDVDDPPPGQTLARLRPGTPDRLEVTPGTTPALVTALTRALHGRPGHFETVESGGEPFRVLVAERADRSRWAVAASLTPLLRQRGELIGVLLLAELAGLAGAVAVAVLLSRRAVAPLSMALASQRRFVADASHELRAPLTVVHTRAQLLARRIGSEPAERLAAQAEQLVADTRALGEVVDDLLTSAEVEQGRSPDTVVDVGWLAGTVVESMATYADSRQVTLVAETPENEVAVRGAESPLRRALTALVDNAIGHVPAGGAVRVLVRRVGRKAHVAVIDNGVGLDPAHADRLFDRFARGDDGAGRRFGLGLALVQHVTHAHGGEVLVSGVPGRGATFTLVLPAVDIGGS